MFAGWAWWFPFLRGFLFCLLLPFCKPPIPFWGFAYRYRHWFFSQRAFPVVFCQFQLNFAFDYWFDDARPLLGTNARQGEAANPGPAVPDVSESSFVEIRCGITNPTCLANKSDNFRNLVKAFDLHLISMSETAATATQQKCFARDLHSADCRVLWGPPVLPHKNTVGIFEHVRGKASGVGILSKISIRPSRNDFPDEWCSCTRILHSVCQAGPISFQVVTIYCKPLSEAASGAYNNRLIEFALSIVAMVNIPFVIQGDFNMPVNQLRVWPSLEAKGYMDLTMIHLLQKGFPMPFSCAEATNSDNAIFSPQLAALVSGIQVLGPEWFATHRPVLYSLRFPANGLFKTALKFPQQIVETGIESDDLEKVVLDNPQLVSTPTSLEEWGQQFELCVDKALQSQFAKEQVGFDHLPKAFKGRCVPSKFVKSPIHVPIKKSWTGHFEPECEVLSFKARQQVTQTRRLQSLWYRLKKWESSEYSDVIFQQLHLEWKAIRRSTAFGEPFVFWLRKFPEIGYPIWPLPSADWIFDVIQIVKFCTNSKLSQDMNAQKQALAYRRQLDQKFHGSKGAFRATKGIVTPPLKEIRQEISDLVCVASTDDPHQVELFGENCHLLDVAFPILLNDVPCKLLEVSQHCALAAIPDSLLDFTELQMRQTQYAIEPKDIAFRLNNFWNPIWQNSPTLVDEATFTAELEDLFDAFPALPEDNTNMTDISLWRSAIKKLRPTAARGVDKISSSELKMLPDCLLTTLIAVLTSYTTGFPSWFMIGIVCPLPKTSLVPEAFQIRPITVLAQLYRLWSSVAVSQLLYRLSTWAPPGVTGLLPGRGTQSVGYRTQFWLEKAFILRERLSGVTLDLVKCFNNISWSFGFRLLARLGVPQDLLQQYIASLQQLVRWCQISGNLVIAGGHSTGYPEGDH